MRFLIEHLTKLDFKDMIYALGIFLTFCIGVVNLWVAAKNSRKSHFLNTVTVARVNWIPEFRGIVAKYISKKILLYNYDTQHYKNLENKRNSANNVSIENSFTQKEYESLKLEVWEYYYLIKLHLFKNIPEGEDTLLKLLDNLHNVTYITDNESFNKLISEFTSSVTKVLHSTWRKIKLESKNGELKNKFK